MNDQDNLQILQANNPFDQPAPTEPIKRAHAFAYDLAYGVAQGFWDVQFQLKRMGDRTIWHIYAENTWDGRDPANALLGDKWNNNPPSPSLLSALGYLDSFGGELYSLSEKALSLLEAPPHPPDVFISYKRDQSSAFALLIEARLKIAGNPNPFLDKNILAGEEWHGHLESAIKQSEFFICLIGPKTLESDMVKQEIAWAEEAGCRIISIWHGCTISDDAPEVLKQRQVIQVGGHSALEYETAVNQLLNSMGYSTY
jgi:hypothetical protein